MLTSLVTGAAGFLGSHISERLLQLGHKVIGVDCFTDYYARELKMANLKNLLSNSDFTLVKKDLLDVDLKSLVETIDYIFHEAAQPGVRASWGENFDVYEKNNILATQKLLEACKDSKLRKFVYASSSSVYGDCELPMKENVAIRPISPYGVSKAAAESLCYLYWKSYGTPAISLRYFTVYGPRQRPDMALHKFIRNILTGKPVAIFGDGSQSRDFTFVSDVVQANILAMDSHLNGEVFNIGGGSRISVSETVQLIENITAKKAGIKYADKEKGDVKDTLADISKAKNLLHYTPVVALLEGLEEECRWISENLKLLERAV